VEEIVGFKKKLVELRDGLEEDVKDLKEATK